MEPLERYRDLVDDFAAFEAACRRPLPTTVRVHREAAEPATVVRALASEGVEAEALGWAEDVLEVDTDAPGLTAPDFLGWTHAMEAASCLPVPALDPEPGAVVWDTCAAPGGKTGHLVDAMDDRGLVLATDASLGRLSALRFNTERLGATCTVVDHADARHVSLDPLGIDAVDAALVDAPCSSEGTVRKRPDVLDEWSLEQVRSLAGLQRDILARAVAATRPGGRVVYATCTFAPEENEAVVDAVLGSHDCELEAVALPVPTADGVTRWRGETFDPSLARARRIYPHLSDTGGFFVAALRVGA
ncbi:MAG: RsmB/NOP family class I SAM-dependent RNA methyltransferase [Halobacteriales archaeon]